VSEFFWRGLLYVGLHAAGIRLIAERNWFAVPVVFAINVMWMSNSAKAGTSTVLGRVIYGMGAAIAVAVVLVW
jgi:hypothetical protein